MNRIPARVSLFAALIFTACAMTACKTNSESESPQMSTVIGLAGHARYQDGRSEKWRTVKVGSLIPQGSVIQTDQGPTNAVCISLGRSKRFSASLFHVDYEDLNHVILNPNSALKLDRVTASTVGGKKIWDTRLSLINGSVHCMIGYLGMGDSSPTPEHSRGPKLETIHPAPGSSYFEIKSGDIVIHAEHADLYFFPPKRASLLFGAAALEFSNTGLTKDLFGYQTCDLVTGEIAELKLSLESNSEPDFRWHYLPQEPPGEGKRFEVPQRPF